MVNRKRSFSGGDADPPRKKRLCSTNVIEPNQLTNKIALLGILSFRKAPSRYNTS